MFQQLQSDPFNSVLEWHGDGVFDNFVLLRLHPIFLLNPYDDSQQKNLLLHKGCINIQSERWRSMDASPGEGEQAKGGERQDVASARHPSGTPSAPFGRY